MLAKNLANNSVQGHYHDIPEKENSNKGFLDLFLEIHVHSVVSNDILLTNESNTKQFDAKKDIDTFVSVSPSYQSSINYDKNEKIKVYYPPNNYFNSYLSSLDSRGPPTC